MFQLTRDEVELVKSQIVTSREIKDDNLKSQIVTSSWGGKRKLPYAFHDRFLIIDGVEGYHIGASLKDAGKKCFGITKIEGPDDIKDIMKKAQQTSV